MIDKLPPELHLKAFNNSLQATILFVVSDGCILTANRSACKLLGYSKKDLLTKNRKDIFDMSEKAYKKMMKERKLTGSVRADLSMITKAGILIPCEISCVIFKDSDGISNSILSITDLRKRLNKQQKIDIENKKIVDNNIVEAQTISHAQLQEKNNWIKSIVLTSYDVIWEWDIKSNVIAFGKTYENVFGYKLPGNKMALNEWIKDFLPSEGVIIEDKLNKALTSEDKSWEESYQLTYKDKLPLQVISRANIIRDSENNAIRMIGVIHDQSKVQRLEGILEQGIRIKEKQIIEAIVEAKEIERSDLGMELHDNINQLLGASMLYLKMARNDIKNADIYLIHSSEYTLTAIDEIRKLSKGMMKGKKAMFKFFIEIDRVINNTMESHPVKINRLFDHSMEQLMSEKFKVNTFRIFQEQLNNIIKHSKATEININISRSKGQLIFCISDNGVGFNLDNKTEGIGIANINTRSELYKGTADFITSQGKGCKLLLSFPQVFAK